MKNKKYENKNDRENVSTVQLLPGYCRSRLWLTHSFMPIFAAFSSGSERSEKGRVGKRLFTSLKNALEDLTWK